MGKKVYQRYYALLQPEKKGYGFPGDTEAGGVVRMEAVGYRGTLHLNIQKLKPAKEGYWCAVLTSGDNGRLRLLEAMPEVRSGRVNVQLDAGDIRDVAGVVILHRTPMGDHAVLSGVWEKDKEWSWRQRIQGLIEEMRIRERPKHVKVKPEMQPVEQAELEADDVTGDIADEIADAENIVLPDRTLSEAFEYELPVSEPEIWDIAEKQTEDMTEDVIEKTEETEETENKDELIAEGDVIGETGEMEETVEPIAEEAEITADMAIEPVMEPEIAADETVEETVEAVNVMEQEAMPEAEPEAAIEEEEDIEYGEGIDYGGEGERLGPGYPLPVDMYEEALTAPPEACADVPEGGEWDEGTGDDGKVGMETVTEGGVVEDADPWAMPLRQQSQEPMREELLQLHEMFDGGVAPREAPIWEDEGYEWLCLTLEGEEPFADYIREGLGDGETACFWLGRKETEEGVRLLYALPAHEQQPPPPVGVQEHLAWRPARGVIRGERPREGYWLLCFDGQTGRILHCPV